MAAARKDLVAAECLGCLAALVGPSSSVHRILLAYASLLRIKHPRKAAPWFTALVYLNPMDNVGARFLAPGGPGYPRTFG